MARESLPGIQVREHEAMMKHDRLIVSDQVAAAIARGRPVVALETTLVTHGLPHPHGLRVALALEEAIRDAGATPVSFGAPKPATHRRPGKREPRILGQLNHDVKCGGIRHFRLNTSEDFVTYPPAALTLPRFLTDCDGLDRPSSSDQIALICKKNRLVFLT